jgi:hypothetical protein
LFHGSLLKPTARPGEWPLARGRKCRNGRRWSSQY